MGRVTSYAYDSDNRQISEQDPNPVGGGATGGPVTSLRYDLLGNVTAQIDAANNETDNTYDLRGNLRSTTGPAATSGGPRPTISYVYDKDQELKSETNALGGVTYFTYNTFGELTERQDPLADPSQTASPTTQYLYDADGNRTAVVDPNNATTYYSYDSQNRLVEEIDPPPAAGQAAPTTTYRYDSLGELIETVDPMGRVTQYQYDNDGNRTATIAPSLSVGISTTTSDVYDLEGNLVAETSPNGATTTNQYDLMNRLTKTIQPVPLAGGAAPVTQYQYDADGELTATISPLGLTQTESYDGLGNLLSEVAFDGVTTTNSYNMLSQLVGTEQKGGGVTANLTTNIYDPLGRLTSTTDGNNGVTRFGYDLAGDRTSLTDSDGNRTTWQYDGLGRPIAERLPTGALDTFQYDLDGNLTQSVDGDGHVIQTSFDALDRPTSQTWTASAAVLTTPSDTIDTVTLEDGVAGGTWTLAYNGVSSSAIAYNATAAQVQAALEQIPALSGNVAVSGLGGAGQPFIITFVGALANQGTNKVGTLTGDFNNLTVGASYQPSSSLVQTINVGGQSFIGEQQVVGYAATGSLPITQGDFTLSFNGQTTGNILYNATAAQVQAALENLSTIGSGNVMVTGGVSGDAGSGVTGADLYTVDFTGAFGGGDTTLPKITIQSAGLADSNGSTADVALEAYTLPPAAAATAAAPSAAAQQLVVTAASGSFTLGFLSETTAAIPLPTTAAAVQTALENLPLIGTGNVQVIGQGTWASPFYISFTGDMAGQNLPPLTLASTASVANTVATSYNADSQISTIGDNYSDYAYGYDGQGNVATVDNAGTPGVPDVVLTSGYDGMGNRTSLAATIANVKDFVNNYSYDNLSRLYDVIQQSQTGGNAVAPKQVYYQLDPIGDVTEIDRSTSTERGPNPNGFADSILSYWPTTGQLKEINHESGGVSVDDLTYTYDGVGRVQTFGSIDGVATYAYDPMSQLKSATYTTASGGHQPANESFNFDSNGNRPAENGTTTTDNEVQDDGTFHYTFDGAGNRLTRTRDSSAPANDYEVSYTWDAANRLVEVQNFNNSNTLTEQINYTYDVFDHLIERVDDIIGGATTTTHYIWDDAAGSGGIVLALNGAGDVINRYLNGPNTNAYDQFFSTLAEENDAVSPAVVTWDLLDAEGSLRDVVSSAGAVLDHLNYNSFGQITYESSPSVSHIDGYAGGLYDPSTGLVYFIHRWYDPLATVWISADPAGFAAGDLNLSRYVGNDPLDYFDHSGSAKEHTRGARKSTEGIHELGKARMEREQAAAQARKEASKPTCNNTTDEQVKNLDRRRKKLIARRNKSPQTTDALVDEIEALEKQIESLKNPGKTPAPPDARQARRQAQEEAVKAIREAEELADKEAMQQLEKQIAKEGEEALQAAIKRGEKQAIKQVGKGIGRTLLSGGIPFCPDPVDAAFYILDREDSPYDENTDTLISAKDDYAVEQYFWFIWPQKRAWHYELEAKLKARAEAERRDASRGAE